jgi:transcriptional regulator with XRE-family HTH domain
MEDPDWDEVAGQLVRALRAHRSQVAFSRRLGYRSNVAADWEVGRRWPDAERFLAAATRCGVDVDAAMMRFHPKSAAAWRADGLPGWLRALQGTTARRHVAARSGATVTQVGRWLRGEAVPRLPALLALVDAMTGRVGDWIDALVDVDRVPAIAGRVRGRQEVVRVLADEPWTPAILGLLSTLPPGEPDPERRVAERLGVPVGDVERVVRVLERGGVILRGDDGLRVLGLTVDVPADAEAVARQRRHWAATSLDRLAAPHPGDRHAFNVFAVSRADLERLLDLQSRYFRELRAIVAASEPAEVVALVTMHTMRWEPHPSPEERP